MNVQIEIPEVPKALNPRGLNVEVSAIGNYSPGDWPLRYSFTERGWVLRTNSMPHTEDDISYLTARLVEPFYAFRCIPRTEAKCVEILKAEYTRVLHKDYKEYIKTKPQQGTHDTCSECPFFKDPNYDKLPDSMQCGDEHVWVFKDTAAKLYKAPDTPAKKARGHRKVLFSVNSYDEDGTLINEGIFLHFFGCVVHIAETFEEFEAQVRSFNDMIVEIKENHPEVPHEKLS